MGFFLKTFAHISESSSDTQRKWEKGSEHPSLVILDVCAKIGVDVFYIITGKYLAETTPALSASDKLFLSKYETASIDVRNAALLLLLNGETEPDNNSRKIGFY